MLVILTELSFRPLQKNNLDCILLIYVLTERSFVHQEYIESAPSSPVSAKPPHLSDCTEDLLLVGVHFGEGSDLGQVHIFPVAQSNNFIKGKYEIEAVFRDLGLLQHPAVLRDLKK